MSDENKEKLHSVLRDLIKDESTTASATLHDYFSSKSREVLGFGEKDASSSRIDDKNDLEDE
jgi:CRISPR/Cas system-associated protein Csm6